MGGNQSYSNFAGETFSGNVLGETSSDFFEIGFDDILAASNFRSDLFDRSSESVVQALNLPRDITIVDFLSDPVAFAAVSTTAEVWRAIIAPILSGRQESKSYMHQLLTLLFKYFKDHPIPILDNEYNRRNEVMENFSRERNVFIPIHYAFSPSKFEVNEAVINSLINDEAAFRILPIQKVKRSDISAHPDFALVTQQLINIAKHKLSDKIAFALFKWGIFASDLTAIVYSLLLFGQLISEQKKLQKTLDFSVYSEFLYKYSLLNSIFAYPIQRQTTKTEIYDFKIENEYHRSTSALACDPSHLYIVGLNQTITIVDLSHDIIDYHDRFRKVHLEQPDGVDNLNQIGIAASNGFAVVLGVSAKPQLYKLPEFEYVSELPIKSKAQKLRLPLTSDGFYIYSLHVAKKKLHVFVLKQTGAVLVNSISLHSSNKVLTAPYSELIPKDLRLISYCNGAIYTIVMAKRLMEGSCEYIFRHFSMIDGSHLIDQVIPDIKWIILSIACYPWNRKMFEIAVAGPKSTLVQYDNFGSQPLWISGTNSTDVSSTQEITAAKNTKSAFQNVLNFLSYYSGHFHGYSFRSFIGNSLYDVPSSQFFAPCSLYSIKAILESITFFTAVYLSNQKNETKEAMHSALMTLFRLLDMNLSNFSERNVKGTTVSIDSLVDPLIDCFVKIISLENLGFLHNIIGFTFVNSFSRLFKSPTEKLTDLFLFLLENLSEDFVYYMVKQISHLSEFAYVISKKNIRHVFPPILKKLKQGVLRPFEKEFLSSYMRTIMLEMRRTYSEFQAELPEKEQRLSDSFHAFSNVVVEEATPFFRALKNEYNEEQFCSLPFVRFFTKWLALLEPFPQFNRASIEITSIIQPIYSTIARKITQMNVPSEPLAVKKGFYKIYLIFFELFSLFVNSISALLDGGAEIRDVSQYMWLIKASIEAKTTPQIIDGWTEALGRSPSISANNREDRNRDPKINYTLVRGLSFNIANTEVDQPQLTSFIMSLTSPDEIESTSTLMNYLYLKVKNPLNKKLTPEERKFERIVLAALSKQLGISAELFVISLSLISKGTPVLSHFLKQVMESVYRIRRATKLSKQMTAQFRAKCEANMSPPQSSKIEEDYDSYVKEIIRKAAFLLNIQPCLRSQSLEYEQDFPEMLKHLQQFLTAGMTITSYFQMIESINTSSKHISTGIALIHNTLRENTNRVCSYYMIEQFASNSSIVKYLSTMDKTSPKQFTVIVTGLIPLLVSMITDSSNDVPLYSIIVLFMNLSLSIAKFSEDSVFNEIGKLIVQLESKKGGTMSDEDLKSFLVFIASVLLILVDDDPSLKENDAFIQLLLKFFNPNKVEVKKLPLAKICYKAGIEISFKASDLLSLMSNCSPYYYHLIASFVHDIICNSTNKIDILYDIMNTIAKTVSGGNSPIMSSFDYSKSDPINGKFYKSPSSMIGGCSELIQICRRLLNQNDDDMVNIICVVLGGNVKKGFSKFCNDMFLYAVFAILSNIVDEIHPNSILKNTKTNAIYYVASIINEICGVWKLPINPDSVIINLTLSPDFVPVSLMPFQISMFNRYDLLIPYFTKALEGKINSMLSVLICSSLREYATNQSFLSQFFSMALNLTIKNIKYNNSSPIFTKLLRSHLSQTSAGFLQKPPNSLEFYDIFDPFKKATNPMKVGKSEIHLYSSSVISLDNDCRFTVDITATDFDIGIFCPSFSTSADYMYYSNRDQVYEGTVEVIYDKLLGVSIEGKNSKTAKIIKQPFCFVMLIISTGKAKYEYKVTKEHSFIPGKIVFKKNRIAPSHIRSDRTSFSNLISSINLDQKSIKNMILSKMQKTPEKLSLKHQKIDLSQKNTFISFPYAVVNKLSNSVSINANPVAKTHPPVIYKFDPAIDNRQKIPHQHLFKYLSKGDCSVFFSTCQKVTHINKFTGEAFDVPVDFIESVDKVPIISPFHFQTLPSELINYYSTGITTECCEETINWVFIQFLNSNSIPICKTLEIFGITNQDLMQHILNLLFILEPIEYEPDKCLINYEQNSFDRKEPPRLSSLHSFSSALMKILTYIEENKLLDEIIQIWYDLLKSQFYNGRNHSSLLENMSSYHIDNSNVCQESNHKYKYDRPDISGWIVCCDRFCLCNASCLVNGVQMKNPLIVVNDNSLKLEINIQTYSLVLIPYVINSNDTLNGTFFDLAISFKYFINFISHFKDKLKKMTFFRNEAYRMLIYSVIAKSPFFFTYLADNFRFIREKLKTHSFDLDQTFVRLINILALYCVKAPIITEFLFEMQDLWDERVLIPLMSYFPDFMTENDKAQVNQLDPNTIKFAIPSNIFPDIISPSDECNKIISAVKRVLVKYQSISGFPFHILLRDWAAFILQCPPVEIKLRSENIIQVKFTLFLPQNVTFETKDRTEIPLKVSSNPSMTDAFCVSSNHVFEVANKIIYIEANKIGTLEYVITSNPTQKIDDFIFYHIKEFTTDVRSFVFEMTSYDDQQIMGCIPEDIYKASSLRFKVLSQPAIFVKQISKYPLHLVLLRAKMLLFLNWYMFSKPSLFETDIVLKQLIPSITISLKLEIFRQSIIKLSNSNDCPLLSINRKAAGDIRIGLSTDLSQTIICQMAYLYKEPEHFRNKTDRPWHVDFKDEKGIDVGGPARELVAECAADLSCPLCGLVVPTPNARNDVGEMRDCFIPIPNPKISASIAKGQYEFAGALIGICIRTGLVQQLMFPPLVWEFLLSGKLEIERIFEIDKNYKIFISSLTEAAKSEMSNDEFLTRFNLKFVVIDSTGKEVPLTQRGKAEQVDKSNCGLYISLANQFRLNEMKTSLESIRKGLWDNLGLQPMAIMDWATLEYAACGQKGLSTESLRAVTEFSGIESEQIAIFWKVIEAFTPKERSDLLKFATGRVRLPPQIAKGASFLILDSLNGIDILPTSSTCFHKLHYPMYSCFEKAYQLIKIAMEYTGTFENS